MKWGVDSWSSANREIRVPAALRHGGAQRQTLYEFLTNSMHRAPDFWGRYLNTYASGLTPGEVNFLREHSCKILFVYNGPREPLTGPNSHRAGQAAATEACRLAHALDAPPRVRIYADLENWSVSSDWMRGWFEVMWQSEFAGMGGLYGRGAELANPFLYGGAPFHPQRLWSTAATTAVEDELDELWGQMEACGAPAKWPIPYVWSNMPRNGGDPPMAASTPERQAIPTDFQAVGPAGQFIRTAVWQYRLNCPLGTDHPLVDMDLATDEGFADMWGTEGAVTMAGVGVGAGAATSSS